MEEILRQAPRFLLRPLAVRAVVDDALLRRIEKAAEGLPDNIGELTKQLRKHVSTQKYDAAVNLANAHVWERLDDFFAVTDRDTFKHFCSYIELHLPQPALARCIRRMVVHPQYSAFGRTLLKDSGHWEVSLPRGKWSPWSSNSWLIRRLAGRRRGGTSRQRTMGVPEIQNIAELRELLGIRSTKQLGFFLSAAAEPGGPYTSFEIGKRSGAARVISAPCPALLWVQRRILRKILAAVSPHGDAHGFVPGRSTVTNAAPHVGAKLVLKFDIRDFFPTIHQHRVLGLFASFGYHVGNGRFHSDDRTREVAPVLARLCCVAGGPRRLAVLPQGAPTSPAISNLVCRRLDERLRGLARKFNGTYTRYADDLTFSFGEVINVGRFRWWVDQIVQQEGFSVNQQKFHAIRNSQQQQVTGIVVNQRMSVPRSDRRRFRAILHNCRTQGIDSQSRGNPAFRDYLRGFASYVQMVDAAAGAELTREVNDLLASEGP